MNDFFRESLFAGVTLSLLSYFIGSVLKKKFKLGIFNPLLISIIITIIVLAVSGVDYDVYNQGARYLSWFLTPATVCLAIPLYEQWSLLKKNYKAVVVGIASGVDEDGNLCGDVDFEDVAGNASVCTPVPGGVGSVTTSVLAKHLLKAAKARRA